MRHSRIPCRPAALVLRSKSFDGMSQGKTNVGPTRLQDQASSTAMSGVNRDLCWEASVGHSGGVAMARSW